MDQLQYRQDARGCLIACGAKQKPRQLTADAAGRSLGSTSSVTLKAIRLLRVSKAGQGDLDSETTCPEYVAVADVADRDEEKATPVRADVAHSHKLGRTTQERHFHVSVLAIGNEDR